VPRPGAGGRSVLLVDWLGRGGIAQTTDAWAGELRAAGAPVLIATRPGRELAATGSRGSGPTGRVAAHRAVVRRAVDLIEEHRPATVVVQNYLAPPLEWPVLAAARRAGAVVVLVVHNHQPHSWWAGTAAGLGRSLRMADVVVAHSGYVARAVSAAVGGRDVVQVPLPVPADVPRPGDGRAPVDDDRLTAIHFGVLRRDNKGTRTVLDLADAGVPGWRFLVVGAGAPAAAPGAEVVPGYVSSAFLLDAVAGSAASVLPNRSASQSAAVVLAQALGSVVVTTAVGGVAEQVDDGVTGRLLARGAPPAAWRRALADLADPAARAPLAAAAQRKVWDDHARFAAAVRELARAALPRVPQPRS